MRMRRDVFIMLALAGVTLAVYWPVVGFPFVNYDDHRYVTENRRVLAGLTPGNIAWAFTTFEFSNWHPLTWLSLMLDAHLHHERAGGFHLTNLLLHIANSVLLMLLMLRLTAAFWRSALVAALFALHPLHVESVAWVSERKDVLSTFFGMLAMLAYVRYARGRSRRRLMYALVLACFGLSLMSKPMLVTLPCLLLLLDWWPLQRAASRSDWPRLIVEKIPLIAMSVASCILTIAAQRTGGAVRDLTQVPLNQRLGGALVAYGEYLWQTVWPTNLAVFYPHPAGGWPAWTILLAGAALVAITVACVIASRRRHQAPLAGWLWFLGTLTPVIGLVQVGAHSHADRYTYFPLIGLFIGFAWLLPAAPPARVRLTTIIATSCVLALAAVCSVQVGYWRDSATLARRALSVTDDNAVAHLLLGNALLEEGDLTGALWHLEEATRIDPHSPQGWHNLGFAYAQATMNDEAIDAYQRAIAQRPDFAENHFNLGLLLQAAGRQEEARESLRMAAELAARAGHPDLAAQANEAMQRLTEK